MRVLGAPAHAGEAGDGANAIEASYAAIEALRALEAELNAARPALFAAHPHPINLNVGMIRGGDWPSTVAGECALHCRLALYPGERVAALKERVERTVAEVPAPGSFRFEVRYDGFQCEGYELAQDAPLVGALADTAARATGERPPLFASTATTDARSFQLYGAHAGGLPRPGRRARARSRRARPSAVGHAHRASVHRRLVRRQRLTRPAAASRSSSSWKLPAARSASIIAGAADSR